MPMFILSYQRYVNGVNDFQLVEKDVETFNTRDNPVHQLYITCRPDAISETDSKDYFGTIQKLTDRIKNTNDVKVASQLLLQRAVAYTTIYNYDEALNDLNDYLSIDSVSELAYWQRGFCHSMVKTYDAQHPSGSKLMLAKSVDDFRQAIKIDKDNAYLYYNLANAFSDLKDYKNAIANYDIAIDHNPRMAEAYYNRGLAKIFIYDKQGGLKDLGKAGELGIYDAYAIMKKYSVEK
jgi:tetratricopeptide (TPR) repeat protein